jgi:hypothetical protein
MRGMTDTVSKLLPPPWSVKNARLYFMFARMSPHEIRAYVRAEAEAGRNEYKELFDAAVVALGPTSPEALRSISEPNWCHGRLHQEGGRYADSWIRYDLDKKGYFIESRSIVNVNYSGTFEFVRHPAEGFLEGPPSMVDLATQHEKAVRHFDALAAEAKARREAAEKILAAPATTP